MSHKSKNSNSWHDDCAFDDTPGYTDDFDQAARDCCQPECPCPCPTRGISFSDVAQSLAEISKK